MNIVTTREIVVVVVNRSAETLTSLLAGCLFFGLDTFGREPPRKEPKPGDNDTVGEIYIGYNLMYIRVNKPKKQHLFTFIR